MTKRDTVRGVVFDPGYNYVATFNLGCDVLLWEAESGHLVLSLRAHQRPIKSIDFGVEDECSVVLISGDEEGKIILWKLEPDELGSLQHPMEEKLVSWHHHRVPIRSVRFCGGVEKVVSCDATGKVIVVRVDTQEVLVEFLGGDVSCHDWNFWSRTGGDGGVEGSMFLVTMSLGRMVIWDCNSGKIAGNRVLPEGNGYIEDYDLLTVKRPGADIMSIVCCTDSGNVLLWTPDTIDVKPEDADDEDKYNPNLDDGGNGLLLDLVSLVPDFELKNGFRGVSFGADLSIVAWGLHKAFVWARGKGGKYAYRGGFSAGEGIYGVSYACRVGEGKAQVVVEDGWCFTFTGEK